MSRPAGLILRFLAIAGAPLVSFSCAAPQPTPDIHDEDPLNKIPGMKMAAREKDRSAIPQLVADLDSDDPAVRFYAIESLKRITGQTFDYEFFADEIRRKPALDRWRKWLTEQTTADNKTTGK